MSSRATRPSKVLLTSSEGTEFLIDRDIADMSQLLKCMFQDIGEIGLGTESSAWLRLLSPVPCWPSGLNLFGFFAAPPL